MAELMFKIANENAPDVRSLRPELPAALAELVAQALCKQVALRFQSGDAFASALRALVPGLAGPAEAGASALPDNGAPPTSPTLYEATLVSPVAQNAPEPTVVLTRPPSQV
jgi:serine/threonine-protein kinase